jgi:alkylation response protein AidB-like acyl-CoA dehydrogenase
MDFDFSDEQQSLREAVRRWAERALPFERRHAIARAGGATRELHRELAGLGLAGLQVPEAHGGMGLGPVEAMVVAEELGRGLVNAPWAEAAVMAPALLGAAPAAVQEGWLPRVADGTALVVPALHERAARYRLAQVGVTAVVANAAAPEGGFALTGAKTMVPAGDEADAFLVPARLAGAVDAPQGIGLFLVERAAAQASGAVRGFPTHDGARAAELLLARTPATLLARDALPLLEQAVDAGLAAQMAEAVGLMERLLELTVGYMNQRRQFGVPIASFQALRHRVADAKMQLELARSMSYYATLRLGDAADIRRRAVSQARVQLGQAMRFVGQQCVQLHGGIGVTDEYLGSHYFKRLTVLEMTYGDTLHHLGEVSARMQDTAGVFA